MQGPDEANKKQKSMEEFDGAEELAREGCHRCIASDLVFSSFKFLLDVFCKRLTVYEPRDREARHASLATR